MILFVHLFQMWWQMICLQCVSLYCIRYYYCCNVTCRQFMASTTGSHMLKSTSVSLIHAVHCWFLLKNCVDLVVHQNAVMYAYMLKPVLNGSSAYLLALKLIYQVCFQFCERKMAIVTIFEFFPMYLLVFTIHTYMCSKIPVSAVARCWSQAGIVLKWLNGSSWFSVCATPCYEGIWVSQKLEPCPKLWTWAIFLLFLPWLVDLSQVLSS